MIDSQWSFGSYGFTVGYLNLLNPCLNEVSKVQLLYENNKIINTQDPLETFPFTINNDYLIPSISSQIIFRNNILSNLKIG